MRYKLTFTDDEGKSQEIEMDAPESRAAIRWACENSLDRVGEIVSVEVEVIEED